MRSLFAIPKSPIKPVFLHEYQSHRLKRHGHLAGSCSDHSDETNLSVVFDGGTQRRFSSVRIIVYCDVMSIQHACAVRRLEPLTDDKSRGQVHYVPQNPTLPQLTVVFKISLNSASYRYVITPPSSVDELCRQDSSSLCILLESTHLVTPDTLSASVAFEHSNMLRASSNSFDNISHHVLDPAEYTVVRTVRVIPVDGTRPRRTISCLPTELLLKIFEDSNSCAWQHDLLSFAQVCRQWSQFCMNLLWARFKSSEWKSHCPPRVTLGLPEQSLDVCAFAKAFSETPALALGVYHLDIDEYFGLLMCWHHKHPKELLGFASGLIVILYATKNLQHLKLGLSLQTNITPFSAPRLHTVSITRATDNWSLNIRWQYTISTTQLARCMARWPALTSLTVERLKPGSIGMGRFFLRRSTCTLKHLCIRDSHISDGDLLYLTASSTNTLVQVMLDYVQGITRDGLLVFLNAISPNVISLTIRDVLGVERPRRRMKQPVLDDVVDKMRYLQELNVSGDLASEDMLRRRSEVFLRSGSSGVPVVRLSFRLAPRISNCTNHEWAGWVVV